MNQSSSRIMLVPRAAQAIVVLAALTWVLVGRAQPVRSSPDESAPNDNSEARLRPIPRIPPRLKPVLIALRRGNTNQANHLVWNDVKLLKAWLSNVLVKDRTTRDDILTLLGPALHDLDRPKRDAIHSAQYQMGSHTARTSLVFDFDARTGKLKLVDWSTSQAICGLCPHVFADDGRWRLEGKLLAGCLGAENEGADTLVLPRLIERNDRRRVKVSNLAPEVEYLDQIQLGSVPLQPDQELDMCSDGRPYVWHPERELPLEFEPRDREFVECAIDLRHRSPEDVVVLEARNTSTFENDMREFVLGSGPRPPSTDIQIQFDGGSQVRIAPVGTKFLRRVVVPIPDGAREMRLQIRPGIWLLRRLWTGTGRAVDSTMHWQSASGIYGRSPASLELISQTDRERLVLEPQQEIELEFLRPQPLAELAKLGFVLKITGYYWIQRATQE